MESIFDFLRAHFEYTLIAGGVFFTIAAIRGWKWAYEASEEKKARYAFIFEMWGEKGYGVFVGICGLLLIFSGLVFLWLK